MLRPIRACSWASSLARAVIWARIPLDSGPRQVFSGNEVRREPRRPLNANSQYHISALVAVPYAACATLIYLFPPIMGLLLHFPVDRL